MKIALQDRQTIDDNVSDANSQYIPKSGEYLLQTKTYKTTGRNNSQDYIKSLKVKFLDWHHGLPKKGDPRRKEYLAVLSN